MGPAHAMCTCARTTGTAADQPGGSGGSGGGGALLSPVHAMRHDLLLQVVDEALGEVRRHFHRRMMAYRTDKALYDAQKPIEDMRLSLLAATGGLLLLHGIMSMGGQMHATRPVHVRCPHGSKARAPAAPPPACGRPVAAAAAPVRPRVPVAELVCSGMTWRRRCARRPGGETDARGAREAHHAVPAAAVAAQAPAVPGARRCWCSDSTQMSQWALVRARVRGPLPAAARGARCAAPVRAHCVVRHRPVLQGIQLDGT